MQEWLPLAGGHSKVEYCSGSHLQESGFRSIDLSLAFALSLGRGLRRIVVRSTTRLTRATLSEGDQK